MLRQKLKQYPLILQMKSQKLKKQRIKLPKKQKKIKKKNSLILSYKKTGLIYKPVFLCLAGRYAPTCCLFPVGFTIPALLNNPFNLKQLFKNI